MKVLYLVTGIRPPAASGSEFIKNLIFDISKKGVDATILSPVYIQTSKNMREWILEQEKKYKVRLILVDAPLFIKKRFMLHFVLTPFITTAAVIKLLLRERFDIVHEFTSTPILLVRALLYRIFRIRSIFSLSVLNSSIVGRLFWFKLFNFANMYLIPSRELISKLIELGISREKILYLPPGINVGSFKTKLSKAAARKKLGLPESVAIFTYYGALTEEKGVFDLIAASKLVSKDILFALFCYYLKDSDRHKVMIKKLKKSAAANVTLYEKYVVISELLRASDCVIYPQRSGHGTTIPPISVLEILASGTPIIATKIPGVSELISKENGILIPASDPESLADAIDKLHLDSKVNKGENLDEFEIKNVVKKLFLIYKKVHEK